MAFKHKDIGGELTRTEWEANDAHEADGQTANDMLYFNGTHWIRATRATILSQLSGQAGADFSINTHKITNVVDPTANQDAATKKYIDDRDATREFFIPVTYGTEMSALYYFPAAYINAEDEVAYMSFFVPHDYSSIVEAVVMIIPAAGFTHRFNLYSDYGANGEVYSAHSEAALDVDVALTLGYIDELDVSGILSALAAGDYVGIKVLADGTNTPNVYVVGLRFKYS